MASQSVFVKLLIVTAFKPLFGADPAAQQGAGFVVNARQRAAINAAQSPDEITLGEVISVVDPQPSEISSSAGTRDRCHASPFANLPAS
ncbi:MAG: hypothetical protein U0894_01050 [Pirellulales bacterium]